MNELTHINGFTITLVASFIIYGRMSRHNVGVILHRFVQIVLYWLTYTLLVTIVIFVRDSRNIYAIVMF